MASQQHLDFQLEEPGDDPLCDQVVDILQKTLQPESELTVETAVQQLTLLLPEERPYSSEVGRFLTACYEVAEQIPYWHSSMSKLVTVVDSCLTSSRLLKVGGAKTDQYQKLVETLRDWWDSSSPAEDTARFVNFQTFAARVHQHGMVHGAELAVWILQDTFEKNRGDGVEEREAYVKAASQWLLLHGDVVYREVTDGTLKPNSWRHWREQLDAVVDGKTGGKACRYSQETVDLAARAGTAMKALERQKSA